MYYTYLLDFIDLQYLKVSSFKTFHEKIMMFIHDKRELCV